MESRAVPGKDPPSSICLMPVPGRTEFQDLESAGDSEDEFLSVHPEEDDLFEEDE